MGGAGEYGSVYNDGWGCASYIPYTFLPPSRSSFGVPCQRFPLLGVLALGNILRSSDILVSAGLRWRMSGPENMGEQS
jgi:hypothetical protein